MLANRLSSLPEEAKRASKQSVSGNGRHAEMGLLVKYPIRNLTRKKMSKKTGRQWSKLSDRYIGDIQKWTLVNYPLPILIRKKTSMKYTKENYQIWPAMVLSILETCRKLFLYLITKHLVKI